jgi:hypothetical protein
MGSGSGDGGLSLGTHRVQVRLLLPGSDFVLTAPEEEVTFKCDDASAEAGSDVANDVPGGDSDDAVAEDRLGNGSTGSGCSAGRSSFGVPLLVILLLATAVAMFGRRKAV